MRSHLTVTRNMMPTLWTVPGVDEVFEKAMRNPLSIFEDLGLSATSDDGWFEPKVDVDETEQGLLLSVDLPGLKKEDIKIGVAENVLTVDGERKREYARKDKDGARRIERSYGQFQRSFRLPQTIDACKIEASMEDGVLRIALPKSETAKPRSIEVQPGKGGFFSKLVESLKIDEKKADDTKNEPGH